MKNKIESILASKFPIQKFEAKPKFISALVPLLPNQYRNESKDLVLTGNQWIFIGKAKGGWYGIIETCAKVRNFRCKNFNETKVNKTVETGKTALEVAKKLVKSHVGRMEQTITKPENVIHIPEPTK